MEFLGLMAFGTGLFILVTFFMPWVLRGRLNDLREQVERLQQRVALLESNRPVAPAPTPAPVPEPAPVPARSILPEVAEPQPPISIAPPLEEEVESRMPAPYPQPVVREGGFEFQFGARLPVWIGGFALALAGFYLVRYSIEMGWLGPAVQVLLGLMFGGGLVAAAHKAGPYNARIGQALAGAGIADLYASLFAATSVYHLFPQYLGFAGMAGVTALAVVMALRHGTPIAVLGMIGGFVTPLLVGSNEPDTPLLLAYLYILFTGLFWVIRRQAWWGLLLLITPFVLLWSVVLLFTASVSELFFLSLFLLALGATVVAGTRTLAAGELPKPVTWANGLVIGLGAVMVGIATARSGFCFMERGLLFLLATGGLALGWFDPKTYRAVPWLTMAVSLVTLGAWNAPDQTSLQLSFTLFALLHMGVAGLALERTNKPVFWSLVGTVAAALFYLLAYARMGWMIDRITLWPLIEPRFLGLLALGLAGLAVEAARRVAQRTWDSEDTRQKLLAVFASATTGFVALGLTVWLEREFLSVCLAAEVAALCLLNLKLRVNALRPLAGLTALAFAAVLLPQINLLLQLSTYSLLEVQLAPQSSLPIVNWPIFQLGLPALFFALSAFLLLRQKDTQKDGQMVAVFEVATIALVGTMGYYLMRHVFHPGENILFLKAGFMERGTFTNILFAFGLAATTFGLRYTRKAVEATGLVLAGVGMFRLGWFDLVTHNPLWDSTQQVGNAPLFNGVALTYGLPVLWLWAYARLLPQESHQAFLLWTQRFQGVLIFVFASFTMRQMFHGAELDRGTTSNAEIYLYSVLWLVMALALLVEGTRRHIKSWRVAAIGLMLLTCGKVFLVDTAALGGLWRVASLVGLGIGSIGIYWFYSRFVTGTEHLAQEKKVD